MNALVDDVSLAEKGVNEDNFLDLYEFNFTYSCADETVVELIENGAQIQVTYDTHSILSSFLSFSACLFLSHSFFT
jgi:hypothetical protein